MRGSLTTLAYAGYNPRIVFGLLRELRGIGGGVNLFDGLFNPLGYDASASTPYLLTPSREKYSVFLFIVELSTTSTSSTKKKYQKESYYYGDVRIL